MSTMLNKLMDTLKQLWADKRARVATLVLAAFLVITIGARGCSDSSETVSASTSNAATDVVPAANAEAAEAVEAAETTATTSATETATTTEAANTASKADIVQTK